MLVIATMQQRRGSAADWIAANPVLAQGEMGFETDTGNLKIGDGTTHWVDLDYFPETSSSEWIEPTVSALTYVSATKFSVLGNETATFPAGIRVKAIVSAGTIYGSVSGSVASGSPTSTVVTVIWDSGQLDSGLSNAYVGIFSPVYPSIPTQYFLPTGAQIPYGGDTAPPGFLLEDGAAVSRSAYANLFAVIGTKYGAGDGNTTFNVPDKRGRCSIGQDNMGSGAASRVTDASGIGTNGGQAEVDISHTHTTGDHAILETEMPSHSHVFLRNVGTNLGGGYLIEGGSPVSDVRYTEATGSSLAHNHGSTGSAGSATLDIMNPWEADNWIIKY